MRRRARAPEGRPPGDELLSIEQLRGELAAALTDELEGRRGARRRRECVEQVRASTAEGLALGAPVYADDRWWRRVRIESGA